MSEEVVAMTEAERKALYEASRVFGWQHLVKFSGQSDEWMDFVLLGIIRSVRATDTSTADAGLRERVEALADRWERHGSIIVKPGRPHRPVMEQAVEQLRDLLTASTEGLDA